MKQIVLNEPKIIHISKVAKDAVVLVYSGEPNASSKCYGMLSKQKDGSYNLIRPNGDGQFLKGTYFSVQELIQHQAPKGWNFYILD